MRLFLQAADGSFTDQTPANEPAAAADVAAAWAADVEMDGDLDLVLGVQIRSDGGAAQQRRRHVAASRPSFAAVGSARAFAWADLDGDADPDAAFLDASGSLAVLLNRQAGAFSAEPVESRLGPSAALTVADLDADGAFEVVLLGRDGALRSARRAADGWTVRGLTQWDGAGAPDVGAARVLVGDFDNNGALDLLASTPSARPDVAGG